MSARRAPGGGGELAREALRAHRVPAPRPGRGGLHGERAGAGAARLALVPQGLRGAVA